MPSTRPRSQADVSYALRFLRANRPATAGSDLENRQRLQIPDTPPSTASNPLRGNREIFASYHFRFWIQRCFFRLLRLVRTKLPAWPAIRCRCSAPPSSACVSSGPPRFRCSGLTFFHQHRDDPRGFFNTHGGIIHQHRIRGANQWRHFSLAIAPIPFANFLYHFLQRNFIALFLMFFPTPLRTDFRGSIEENLQLRGGKNHGANVAAFHDDAAPGARSLLFSDQHLANFLDG